MESQIFNLGDIAREAAELFSPPERLTVAEAAQKYVVLNNPPKYVGPWKPHETPYMVEPQNMAVSENHKGLVFCGSSQTGKTQGLVLNTIAFVEKCNPMDILMFGPSQPAARDFSRRRIDRMHHDSEHLKSLLLPGRNADNTHDKTFRSGMILSISWPSLNEMSSKPVPMVLLTEYDRMPDDVDGEGSAFFLSQKRTTSFLNMGMTIAESSPARPVEDAKWRPSPDRPHEAPPCQGILGLYNQGDRRRWYWPCPHCGEFFEGSFSDLSYLTSHVVDGERVPLPRREILKSVVMRCPKNGCAIEPFHKRDMNLKGVWLREGETIDEHGNRGGEPREAEIASYWLRGTAAAYTTWQELVGKVLDAEAEYERTTSQELLKTVYNTDLAEPYIPRGSESTRMADDIMARAQPLKKRHVPPDVRTLFATIDVQKRKFVVQVTGVRPAGHGFCGVVVDRFDIIKSERYDEDGERLHVEPHSYPEDWDLILTQVMDKRYPLDGMDGTMGVSLTSCDSGGKEGVTEKAYAFYRRLMAQGRNDRFILTKGESTPGAPRAKLTFPDTKRDDRKAFANGEIPLLMFNGNILKDSVDGWLGREGDGPQRFIFPNWLDLSFYEELTVEVRGPRGWENKAKRRNESWDLLYYFLGLCVWRQVEKVDWADPPRWLAPWDRNPHVEKTEKKQAENSPVDKSPRSSQNLEQLGASLA